MLPGGTILYGLYRYSALELGIYFFRSYFLIIIDKTYQQTPFTMPLTSV